MISSNIIRKHVCTRINPYTNVFLTFNGYPKWVVLRFLNKFEIDLSTTSSTKNQHPDTHTYACPLPYKGIQSEQTLKHIKREIKKSSTR